MTNTDILNFLNGEAQRWQRLASTTKEEALHRDYIHNAQCAAEAARIVGENQDHDTSKAEATQCAH